MRVTGIEAGAEWLGAVPDHFPALRMAYRQRAHASAAASIDGDRAVFVLDGGRALTVDRETACATYSSPRMPLAADVVHPLLTAAAGAIGLWSGYQMFHAAAFVAEGRVWGLMGDRESGKSTVAACLAQRGYPVVCDDLLAVRGRTALAGPRCIDLRPDAARHLGVGEQAETEGSRERWRLTLAPVDAEIVLGGWVVLTWGDAVDAVRIRPRDLIGRLAAHRTWRGVSADPVGLLDLASLPAWELRRPRGWASFGQAVEAVETATASR
jgi:hypothetical protein